MSDGAPHFKKNTLKLVDAKLGALHCFSVAHSSWSNGTTTTVKRMNLEMVRTFRAVRSGIIYTVRFALNLVYLEQMGAVTFQLMTARVPWTAFSVFAGDGSDGWCVKEETFSTEIMQK